MDPPPAANSAGHSSGRGNISLSRSGVSSREVHVTLPTRDSSVEQRTNPISLEEDEYDPPSRAKRRKEADSIVVSELGLEDYSPDKIPTTPHHPGSHPFSYPEYEEEEDSPYPEVRASVSNIDDPEMPTLTARMWIIGLTLCIIGSAVNTFFNFRYPAPSLQPLVLLLIAHPVGKFFAYSLPIRTFVVTLPRWMGLGIWGRAEPLNMELNFNPGPFNVKEHVLIYIMTNVAVFPAYALNAIVVADVFYHIRLGLGFNILLVLATQLTGFGIAGMCRRFLVWPASLIWPQNLVACTLLNTLHAEEDEGSGGITRYKFFIYASTAAFFWWFLPGFLFQALSVFSWICWFRPNDVVVNQLFGANAGLGMGILTFDWTQIAWIGSPLMIPWWAEVNIMIGFVIMYWIVAPIVYYTDTWHVAHLPLLSSSPFDRFAQTYNVTRVLNPGNFTFNQAAYDTYSPLYLSLGFVLTYISSFAVTTCVLVHTVLYHGPALVNGMKRIKTEEDDVHAKLMRLYPEVPDWWYLAVFLFFFVMGILAAALFKTGIPVWSLFVAVLLPIIYVLPSGFVYAYTGQSVSINLISEVIGGTLLSGRPFTNMVFKAYSTQTMSVAINFVQDLKLGHYIKVAPRASFTAQLVATAITSVVQVCVQKWLFAHVHDICSPKQENHLTCPHTLVYQTASVVWGVIGPTRQFGPSALYKPELYALLFGALAPIPFWLWQRRYPHTRLKYVSMPVLINGPGMIPPAVGINFSSWFVVAFVFQYLIRRRNFRWWSKFNYILSSALDSGTLISGVFIFLTLQFPKSGRISVNWWGNTVNSNSAFGFTSIFWDPDQDISYVAVDGRGNVPLRATGPNGF
ncbi:hypothetical protein BS47DRAFT_1289018 [Hydnum rufescens UP504]|uniref:Oligopeptide transporter n=1 Tax=Hydnum rufescens UP504 TaxID=1448309 RepID=A0A9P6B772_9AGAM|nr:hypothetical protein BS47DRAFT_1289018 [Hydnum rufescens UP504]